MNTVRTRSMQSQHAEPRTSEAATTPATDERQGLLGDAMAPTPAERAGRKATWRIYKDPYNPLANSTSWRAFWSAFCTFNLAIMGSSVLPMPYAISKTGVLVGLLTMLLVALCNDYTTCLTISAAYTTGLDSFEALANWAGGPRWKVFTQVVLISLLWAPNSGGLSLMGDVAQVMINQVQLIMQPGPAATAAAAAVAATAASSSAAASNTAAASIISSSAHFEGSMASSWLATSRSWLLRCLADGQSLMVVMTVLVVLPLSCQKHMRSLETAAAAGMLVILALLAVLMVAALHAGLPAVADGQLPLWSLKVNDQLPEAFSLLGYAFYLQPLIMPIIREMPEGRSGRAALTAAVHSSLLGSSLLLYAGVGFFGAALFGRSTESNIMLNALTNNPWGNLLMNGCMLFYLAAGAAACQYPLRTSIDLLLVGERVPMTVPRAVLINCVTLGVSLAVALLTPGGAEKVYAIVGATGVCIMCYVLPVVVHFKLMRHRQRQSKQWQRLKEQQFQALAVDNSQPIAAVAGSGGVIAVLGRDDGVSAPLLTRHSSASSLTDLVVIPATPVGALLPLAFNPAAALVKPLKYWPNCPGWLDLTLRMLLPVGVLCVGLGFSIAALSVAIHDMRQG